MIDSTAQAIDVPERVATGRALIDRADTYRPRFDRYKKAVGRAMLGTPDQAWRDAVALLEAQQEEYMQATHTHPYSVVVEQIPETGRASIRDLYPSDPVTAEVTADDLAEVLARFGHQVERVRAGWDGVEVTVIVRWPPGPGASPHRSPVTPRQGDRRSRFTEVGGSPAPCGRRGWRAPATPSRRRARVAVLWLRPGRSGKSVDL